MSTSTPWGPSQSKHRHARGINEYSCAGHGGLKVSPTFNAQIPGPLRNASGWYEEDCEYMIVALTFPEIFAHIGVEEARACVKQYFPYKYEAAFGVKVTAAESARVEKDEFAAANPSARVVACAWGSWHEAVPTGKVGVLARPAGGLYDGDTFWLIDAEAYGNNRGVRYVIDPEVDEPWVGHP